MATRADWIEIRDKAKDAIVLLLENPAKEVTLEDEAGARKQYRYQDLAQLMDVYNAANGMLGGGKKSLVHFRRSS